MELQVLYEDNHIIAVVKPSGVLTQGDHTGKISLFDEVKKYLKEKYKKPGEVFLGLVHRLDKPVSGIVLFAKTSKGASRLSEQFRSRQIKKVYHGLVLGTPSDSKGTIRGKVKKISLFAKGFSEKSDEELLAEIKKSVKIREAELSFEIIKSNGKISLLKIIPKTGRFHQIRIQLSEMGNPILGDTKYSDNTDKNNYWKDLNSIALCATEISFKTATENKVINLKINIPENWKKIN